MTVHSGRTFGTGESADFFTGQEYDCLLVGRLANLWSNIAVHAGGPKTKLACLPELRPLSELTVFQQNRRSQNGISIELLRQCVGLSLISLNDEVVGVVLLHSMKSAKPPRRSLLRP